MRKIILLVGCALVAGIGSVSAQVIIGGRVISKPVFDVHRLNFALTDNIYGTSRTAAMGGAFTSLGADLSSMNINPAGLGMYQSSDWGVTQSLSVNASATDAIGLPASGTFYEGGNRTSYGLNNAAIAFNVFNHSSGLTSLTLGFGYNRAANFNSRSMVGTTGETTSIAEMFARQLDFMVYEGLNPDALDNSNYPFENLDIFLEDWGATLGYNNGLASYDGSWNTIGSTDSYFNSVTKGGIYEYTFSAGFNVSKFLYLGASLGWSDINYTEETSYEEEYPASSTLLGSMRYDQRTRINGNGFSAKFGAIARPLPALRSFLWNSPKSMASIAVTSTKKPLITSTSEPNIF
jgi:hypothetical protein